MQNQSMSLPQLQMWDIHFNTIVALKSGVEYIRV
jgi:hypothetical protein